MLHDWPLDELRCYRGKSAEPTDFDAFWAQTLRQARDQSWPARLEPVPHPFSDLAVYDVSFAGWNGEPIKAWLRLPAQPEGPLPGVVVYQGYGGGRGFAFDNLMWAAAGYAVLNVDSRGQGATWGLGDTPDSGPGAGPQYPGWMTRGIQDPAAYYYRRLIADAVLGFEAMQRLPQIDPARVGAMGASQGGALTLAVTALAGTSGSTLPGVAAACPRVPFLCDFRRAVEITDAFPYREISLYLATHRLEEEQVYHTLSYVDGVNFARRASAPLDVSVALMDEIVPPSTIFAMYNNYAGPKKLRCWNHNGHEGGEQFDDLAALRFFAEHLGGRGF